MEANRLSNTKLYLIQNRRNKRFITGTDFKRGCQEMDGFAKPLTWSQWEYQSGTMFLDLKQRHISKKTYKIVEINLGKVTNIKW